MAILRLGFVVHPYTSPGLPDRELFERIALVASTAEDSGFDSVWVGDHFYAQQTIDWTEPQLEAYAVLCGLAARTRRIRLASLVTGVTYRNPAQLAKIVTSLDVMSQGRAILGIGAAWHADEHHDYGFDFPKVAERMDRLSEAVQICRRMFDDGRASFSGEYYSIAGAFNYPRPVQDRIPILVGGSGERRTLRLVAQYADACNIDGSLTVLQHKLDVLERHATDVGRDSAEITKTAIKMVIVRDTAAEAARAADDVRSDIGMDKEAFADFALFGEADQVREQVGALLSIGLDGIICTVPSPFVRESIVAAGETLSGVIP